MSKPDDSAPERGVDRSGLFLTINDAGDILHINLQGDGLLIDHSPEGLAKAAAAGLCPPVAEPASD